MKSRWGTGALAVAVLFLAWPGEAPAEIYRWTDESGTVHFAQSLDKVPLRHRKNAVGDPAARSRSIQSFTNDSPTTGASSAGSAQVRLNREIRIPFRRVGSVMQVEVLLNDRVSAPFLIDTGASGVSLPRRYAEQLGLRTGPDSPTAVFHTANGKVRRPLVSIRSIQLGGARVEGLTASVNERMEFGLLGGTFFNNFVYRVDAAQSVITLAPNDSMRSGLSREEWQQRFQSLRGSLDRVESYLEKREISRKERRVELEARRDALRSELAALDREASLAGVPAGWRR